MLLTILLLRSLIPTTLRLRPERALENLARRLPSALAALGMRPLPMFEQVIADLLTVEDYDRVRNGTLVPGIGGCVDDLSLIVHRR